jgi:aryl-alcohol dehydrogenase-like predicted oxidoreductase
MELRDLGASKLKVSPLCLGAMMFGGPADEATSARLIGTARDAGINFIDTANVYSMGKSEMLLGQALKALGLPREQLIIATKATGTMDETPNGRGQSRHHLFNEVDASLKRLQLDYIDLYQLHGFDPSTGVDFEQALRQQRDHRREVDGSIA